MNVTNLFICGCPRSGTSAAALWLCASERFALGMERYQTYWAHNHSFPDDAFTHDRFFDIHAGDTWYDSLLQFPEYYERLRSSWKQARFLGDKVPSLWRNFSRLFSQFPEAKILFLYRDPFAVARSYKARALNENDRTWGACRDSTLGVLEWNESATSIVEQFNNTRADCPPQHRCFILKYEQLVCNSVDRRALGAFLAHTELLPPAGNWDRAKGNRTPEALSESEKDLLWSLLDTRLIREVERIFRVQRINLAKSASPRKACVRREWYHSEDLGKAEIAYGELTIPGCGYVFRGRETPIDGSQPFGACIGSATTFGRFLCNPYPQQLEAATGKPFYNLGIGGARPETFLANPALMDLLQRAEIVIVELMSARGYPSPLFAPIGYETNMGQFMDWLGWHSLRSTNSYVDLLLNKTENHEPVFIDRVMEVAFRLLDSEQRALLRDTALAYYIRDLSTLVEEIGRPVLALLMTRSDEFQTRRNRLPRSCEEWSGGYPHFVDDAVVSHLQQCGIPVAVCRSRRGVPFTVHNWRNNEPAAVFTWQKNPSINTYYPSQEMHDDATATLLKHTVIQRLITSKAGRQSDNGATHGPSK